MSQLQGFQQTAFDALESVTEEIAALLPVEWPKSEADVLAALRAAGLPRGAKTVEDANALWGLAPASVVSASANMQVTVAMPVPATISPDEKIFGKWAGRRAVRESRYGGLMRGNINVKSLVTFADGLYFMFADLASIISTVEAMADAVASGTFTIEDVELRQSLRQWKRRRDKGLTMDLTDEERDTNWEAVGKLLNPAFHELLEGVAGAFEARSDVDAFDGAAMRTASGGKTSIARLQRSITAAAKFVADQLPRLTGTLDSQADLRDEIDGALVFLRAEEVQRRCGVLDYTAENADAGVAMVLKAFGNQDGAPAIQLGFDWREFFYRMGEVLTESGGALKPEDLFYLGESASAIQADAAFVEFGSSEEEGEPEGKPFHVEPVEPAGARQRPAQGITKRWEVWFLKAKLDFGFSFSQSRQ